MPYVKTTDFLSKDTLSSGNPLKIVKGSEIDTEFNAIATADALNLKKNGSVTPTANLPMGNFKITGLPPATGTGEAVRYDEFNGHIVDTTDAHVATAIGNTPAGGIAATTVQAAINELDTEKAALAGATFTGPINEARGTIAMHATTMDIWAKPNIIDGTGAAVTITAIANAPQAGARRKLYPIAGTIITNGATFAVDGAANYTTAAGDSLEFESVTTSTYKVHIVKNDGTAVVPITFASSAENIAGTVENKAVDPLGIREAFNCIGTAPIYACRAWANLNGTGTIAIRAAGNISSFTDNGIGDYTANFTTAMPDANYVATGLMTYAGTYAAPGTAGQAIAIGAKSTTSQRLYTGNVSSSSNSVWSPTDVVELSIAIFR